MSSIDRVFIGQAVVSGVETPVYTEYERTHRAVADEYYQNINIIYEIYNRSGLAVGVEGRITQGDADAVQAALSNLRDLAINGRNENSVENLAIDPIMKRYFLTQEMASNLDLLMRSFQAVGAPEPWTALTDVQLEKWKDLSVVSTVIPDILRSSLNAVVGNRSIQSLIELEYVRTGNELIEEKLSDLEEALSTTKRVLDLLARLQDIRNRVVIKEPAPFDTRIWQDPLSITGVDASDSIRITSTTGGGIGGVSTATIVATGLEFMGDSDAGMHAADYAAYYNQQAGDYFNRPVNPILSSTYITSDPDDVDPLTAQGMSLIYEVLHMKQSLVLLLQPLSALGGTDPTVLTDTNSLYNRVKAIVTNFSAMLTVELDGDELGAFTLQSTDPRRASIALRRFLYDGNTTDSDLKVDGMGVGDAQQNVTSGITAAQGLNDQQKEEVRRYLFVFEEFYKSASAILQRITQILEKMAQNISR